MKSLPEIKDTPLIRTDFSDPDAWEALLAALAAPNEDDFRAYVQIVDDPEYRDLTPDQARALAPDQSLVILADHTALTVAEMPLLVVHAILDDEDDEDQEDDEEEIELPNELRVIVRDLWSIENNISLGNMDWEEFVEAAEDDGVFRGF